MLKVNEGWRSVLRQTRAAELHDEITVASQTFKREVDHLNTILQNLKLDLQEADHRSDHMRRLHLQNLERLQTQYNQQGTSIQQHFENVLQNLTTKFSSERDQMSRDAKLRRAELRETALKLQQRRQAEMTEIHRLYRDIITTQECDTSDMVAKLSLVDKEQLMEKKELEMIHNKELKVFNELSAKNQQAAQELDAFTKRAKRLQNKTQEEDRNLMKVNDGWRPVFRQARDAELRDDVTVARQMFKRRVDHLDSVLQNLTLDLQEADRHSDHMRRLHLQNMERLQTQYNKRVISLQQHFDNVLQNLTAMFSSERDQMSREGQKWRVDLENAIFLLDQHNEAEIMETHRLYKDIIARQAKAHSDRLGKMGKVDPELLMEKKDVEMMYKKELKVFKQLSAKKHQPIQEIEAFTKRVKSLQDLVMKLRKLRTFILAKRHVEEQDWTEQENQVNQKTQQLWEQLRQNKKVAKKKLMEIVEAGEKVKKKLQATVDKGERILRRIEICNKLERKCGLFASTEEQRPESTGSETQPEVSERPTLIRRLNIATLKMEEVKERRDELRRENKHLKLLLVERQRQAPLCRV
ncbi:dynein regulatory complex subunit 2-like [Antennarius striatus]|uniref:dynein regulatory complex subunit 2-like n=1 Tax=Antennarius striatus TaxID=241820 RepID=UPI0035B1AE3A